MRKETFASFQIVLINLLKIGWMDFMTGALADNSSGDIKSRLTITEKLESFSESLLTQKHSSKNTERTMSFKTPTS